MGSAKVPGVLERQAKQIEKLKRNRVYLEERIATQFLRRGDDYRQDVAREVQFRDDEDDSPANSRRNRLRRPSGPGADPRPVATAYALGGAQLEQQPSAGWWPTRTGVRIDNVNRSASCDVGGSGARAVAHVANRQRAGAESDMGPSRAGQRRFADHSERAEGCA
eukprot:g6613.t1